MNPVWEVEPEAVNKGEKKLPLTENLSSILSVPIKNIFTRKSNDK